MTSQWINYNIYYSQLDGLIVGCAGPLLKELEPLTRRRFWERHYAGGRHLQMRLFCEEADRNAVDTLVHDRVEPFLRQNPSPREEGYSENKARALLEMEDENPGDYRLAYRNNLLEAAPYRRNTAKFASRDSLELLEEFYQDSIPLMNLLLEDPDRKEEHMLRIFFLNTWLNTRDYTCSGVSLRSHWEGFKLQTRDAGCPQIVDLVVDKHRELFPQLRDIMLSVVEEGRHHDPVLKAYEALNTTYRKKARALLEAGAVLFEAFDPQTAKQHLSPPGEESNDWYETLYDGGFLAGATRDVGFNTIRTSTNLLYMLIPAAGLTPLHKFKLGYFVFKTIEDHYEVDTFQTLSRSLAHFHKRAASVA